MASALLSMVYQSTWQDVRSHLDHLDHGLINMRLGQSFEGGISGSPGTEAHGAYAFCALACLCILGKPEDMIFR